MSLESFASWLDETPFSESLKASGVIIPLAQSLHILCVAFVYSGAALLMFDGKPAGIHLAIVNELQAAMEQAGSLDQRVSELESSVNSMVSGASQGCLALLSCAFPADPVPGGP